MAIPVTFRIKLYGTHHCMEQHIMVRTIAWNSILWYAPLHGTAYYSLDDQANQQQASLCSLVFFVRNK